MTKQLIPGSNAITIEENGALKIAGSTLVDENGLIPTDKLGTGVGASKYLRGDRTWQTIAGGGDMLKATYDPDEDGLIDLAQCETNVAGTALVTTHAATATGVHGAGTSTIATTTDITTHAGLTSTHGVTQVAGTADIATHAGLTATHGVAGTIAARADITDTALITADNTTNNVSSTKHGFVPKSTADTSLFLRNGTTPSWAAPAGGSDPWTYVKLAAAFTTTSATAQATNLKFSPSANTDYDIFGMFFVKTASSAITPKVGLTWPTGLTLGVATVYITQAATTQILVNLNAAAGSGMTAAGAMASTAFWPAQMNGLITAGASPSGSITITLASETAGTQVAMGIGSFIKYRSFT